MLAVAATCLVAALVAAPTAGAASASSAKAGPTATTAVTKKKLARDIRTVRRRTNAARRSIRALSSRLGAEVAKLTAAIASGDKTIDDKINTIVATVTPILTRLGGGLTEVGEGLKKAGEGLVALEAGLKELAAGTQDLGDFVTADEYGIVQVALDDDALAGADGDTSLDLVPGCFYESANIPDNAQGLTLSGQCRIPTTATPGSTIHFLTGVRSNENDGEDGADDDVGEAGIVWYEQRNGTGDLQGGGATVPAGAGQPPAVPVPLASEMTPANTPFPFSVVPTDNLIDLSLSQFSGTPAAPTLAAAGNVVSFTLRFTDLSADADDPEA
ncbi:MAG: hypothetical protein M3389_05570 [Actinomycetota bacterium]|nr:hypothetical protein [Actinomycetota bacterium]